MKPQIDMVGIITSDIIAMKQFYTDVLGFAVSLDMESYVEFVNEGVRFALSTHQVLADTTKHNSYKEQRSGQSLELAFRVASAEEVDSTYKELIEKGATAITEPEDKPWGQRAAFFADPDGNIHEVFCDLT